MKRRFSLIALFGVFTFVYGQDFEVSPVKFYFNAEPGTSQVKNLMVKNHSERTQSFLISMGDFTINSAGQKEFVPAGTNKRSISNWLTITPTFFELAPNQEQQIAVSIQPPVDEYGSRWGVIYVRPTVERQTFQADKELAAGMTISPQIIVEVFQTSAVPAAVLSAKIDQLREVETTNSSERRFSAIITNNSDIILQGNVFLILSEIQTGTEKVFPPQSYAMFPKSSQRILLTLPADIPKGTYALAAVLDYGSTQTLEGTQIVIEY